MKQTIPDPTIFATVSAAAAGPNPAAEKIAAYRDGWDRWYANLPPDLRRKLSLHDFKRLGEAFRDAFGIERQSPGSFR